MMNLCQYHKHLSNLYIISYLKKQLECCEPIDAEKLKIDYENVREENKKLLKKADDLKK